MGKTRVYELAQKLGIENKELISQLEDAGIEVKDYRSTLEEGDVQKFEAATAPEEKTTVVEKRINSGLIRRRRKVEPVVAAEKPVVEEKTTVEQESVVDEQPVIDVPPVVDVAEPPAEVPEVTEVSVDEAIVAEKSVEAPAEKVSVVLSASTVTEEAADSAKKTAPEKQEKPAAETGKQAPVIEAVSREPGGSATETQEKPKAKKAVRPTASKATILGRVELPTAAPARSSRPAKGQDRQGKPADANRRPRPRPAGGTPSSAPSAAPAQDRPGQNMPGPVPDEMGGRDQRRKKGKKGKVDHGNNSGDGPRRGRQKREVFEPSRDHGRRRKGGKAQKQQKRTEITVSKAIKRIIRISDSITIAELAKRMGIKANELIKNLMKQGQMVTINHPLDFETASLLAVDFSYEVENVAFDEDTLLEASPAVVALEGDDSGGNLEARPPVVTIMGHVDHGKTSLLDALRSSQVTSGEAGGITQHIGAYDVRLGDQQITFLDTPGHEAFTAMRARGAKVTDIVILVVAADDGVMPQTKEAINHSKAAGVPIIIAINKIDKADANPERVKQELTEFELVPEEWGGDTIFVEVSAKQGVNLDSLLEMILLQAEVLELKASSDKKAKGSIVEARLDRGRGNIATVLVQDGTLKVGDPIVSGPFFGRVRTMTNDKGERVKEAGPSFPVEVTGLSGSPSAGDSFYAVDTEKVAKDIAMHRQHKQRESEMVQSSKVSLDDLFARMQQGDVKELKVVLKADVQGSVEAVREALIKLSTDNCRLAVIHSGVGGITETDISLASASDAIVLGFSVRPELKAVKLAEVEGVDVRSYNIIYDAVNDVKNAMEGLLAPTFKERNLGRVEVRETFSVSKVGTVAGCRVTDGLIRRNALVRLLRDNVVVWEGKLASLKRFKDDVREVTNGYECGMGLEGYNDVKPGDVIEAYEMEEVKTKL